MENGRNMFMGNRGQTGNNNINLAWDMWELNPPNMSFEWEGNNDNSFNMYATATSTRSSASRAEIISSSSSTLPVVNTAHALMFLPHHGNADTGYGSRMHPDPHLVCLKLGKRDYFEDSTALTELPPVGGFSIGKKDKPYYNNLDGVSGGVRPSSSITVIETSATVPRCQVEGCHVALVNVKDYHRRHKVCEMHSKAPRVVVLGLEQRFCQQCSRFHVVSEFDDSKRSCRRRLAGHNERRRKSSLRNSASRNSALDKLMSGRFPYLSKSKGRALSLLSYRPDSRISPSDLSSRSSAALRELIAENRAANAILARQLILDRDWHLQQHHGMEDPGKAQPGSSYSIAVDQPHPLLADQPHGWDKFPGTGSQLTLDLMQASSSAFGMLSIEGEN